jgi:N-acetylglucosaminyl-diphospho-decaprenol L-rhamnosyltransferase
VLELGENLGFGRALNRAVKEIEGDPVVFLNNDVVCQPGFLSQLLAPLAPGVEMVAGVLLQEDRPELIDSAGVVVEKRTLMGFDYLHGEQVSALASAPAPLAPCGGAALFRRAAFEALGGFDERIFIYLEDVDLALRAAAEGMRCALAGGARALHAYSASLGSRSPRKYDRTGWSRGYLLRRYGVLRHPRGALRTLAVEGAVCLGQLARDRTLSGARGRLAGWREGGGLEPRSAPAQGLLEIGLGEQLRLRRERRR